MFAPTPPFPAAWARLAALALIFAAPTWAYAACGGVNALDLLRESDPATAAQIERAADETPNGEGVFWRIDAPDAAPSYLFGTKHTTDRDMAEQLVEIKDVIRDARLLMVELHPAEQAEMAAAMQADPAIFMDLTGGGAEAVLPPDLIPMAKTVLADYGLPYEVAKRMRPWFLQMVMALPPCAVAAQQRNPDLMMDNILAQTARAAGVEVRGLETWEDQLAVFSGMSAHDQREGLAYLLRNQEAQLNEYELLSDSYDQREIALIWEFSRWRILTSDYTFETTGQDAVAEMERTLLTERNAVMAEGSSDEVAKGGVVIAVGALHLIGETGLVAAFQREGYDVTRIE